MDMDVYTRWCVCSQSWLYYVPWRLQHLWYTWYVYMQWRHIGTLCEDAFSRRIFYLIYGRHRITPVHTTIWCCYNIIGGLNQCWCGMRLHSRLMCTRSQSFLFIFGSQNGEVLLQIQQACYAFMWVCISTTRRWIWLLGDQYSMGEQSMTRWTVCGEV